MKRVLKVVGIVLAVLVVAIVLVPFFINVDSFRPEIESKVSAALGRQVHIGSIKASILSGGAEADNITINDDPSFNKGPFLQASSLQIGLQWLPLIFSREIKVTAITVRKPDIVLVHDSAGKWNYSSLGNASGHSPAAKTENVALKADAKKQAASSDAAADFSVDKFEIQEGKIRIAQGSGHSLGKEQIYNKVNLLARNISLRSVMPFTLSALTPGGGALEVEGHAGPLNQQDSAKTPLEAKVVLDHADLAAIGAFDPGSGIGGVLDFDGNIKSDGRRLSSNGKAKANNLQMVKGGSPSRQTINLDYSSDYAMESDTGTVNLKVHAGNSLATASGTVATHGESSVAHLKLAGQNMAVNDLEGLLPAFGVILPSGASLQGGMTNVNLTAEGPLDKLVITGPVSITGTHLSGYNLGSKLSVIAALAGIHPSTDTLIQTFSSGLRVAPEGIRADNLVLDAPQIGQLAGNGTVGSDHALDFKMMLTLASASNGGLMGAVSNIASGGQGKGIPFLVQGTTAEPRFLPSLTLGNTLKALGGIQGSNQQGQGQPSQGLGGLLGNILNKKKKP